MNNNEHKHIIGNNLYNGSNSLLLSFEGSGTNNIYLNNILDTNNHNITATPEILVPLSASYEYDQYINLKNTMFTSSGYNFIYSPVFQGVKDLSNNKQTNFYLTSSHNLFDFIEDTGFSDSQFSFVFILSTENGFVQANDKHSYLFANAYNLANNTIFELEKDPIGNYKIWWNEERVFTVSREEPYNITLQQPIENDIYNEQNFQMLFSSNSAVRITTMVTNTADELIEKYISYDPNTFKLNTIDSEYYFDLLNYNGLYKIDGLINRGNEWVVYHNNVTTPHLNKTATIDHSRSLSGMHQNYLVSIPYKTKIKDNNVEVNFAGLKNFHHVEYEYAYVPVLSGEEAYFDTKPENLKLREYDKIFTGTNQDRGLENIFLGYTTEFAKPIYFEPDKVTYFHYPEVAPRLALSATGMEYIGSMPGTTPNRSDRIYKKMANYRRNIHWGNSRQWQNGTWLCSWLSGAADGSNKPMWVDRWYYPGYTTQKEALTAVNTTLCYYTPTGVDPIYIWDTPSQMTFDPGVWYKYIKFGNKSNEFIVETLKGNKYDALKLYYDDWNSRDVIDLSNKNNNGQIFPNWSENMASELDIDPQHKGNTALVLNGDNYVLTPYHDSYISDKDLSVNFWAYADDWNNAKSAPFVGNYFRGGWRMGYTNNFNTPVLYTIDKGHGFVIPFSNQGKRLGDCVLPKYNDEVATPVALAVDSNQYGYILDNNKNSLYKIDYDGIVLEGVNFGNTELISYIEIAPSGCQDLLFICANNGSCSAFELNCLELESTFDHGSSLSSFTLDLSSNIIYSNATKIIVDNDNTIWALSAGSVFREDELIVDDISINDIGCDKDNNIWGVRNNGSFFKLDLNNEELIEGDVPMAGEKYQLSFSYEWVGVSKDICTTIPGVKQESYNTFVYISDKTEGKIYKLTDNGILIQTIIPDQHIDVARYGKYDKEIMEFYIGGDFASYDYHRKYRYVANNKEPQIYLEYNYFNDILRSPLTQRLYYSAKDFPDTWHHMAFAYDYNNSTMTMYIDMSAVKTITHDPNTFIIQSNESPLVIGKYAGKHISFDSEIDLQNYGFAGRFDGLRIYDNVINNSDLRHIYLTKYNFETITWAMPTGKQNIIEEIERFFKHKLPNMKSQYYNIHITNLKIDNQQTKELIERAIRDTSKKLAPAYTELYKIIWD